MYRKDYESIKVKNYSKVFTTLTDEIPRFTWTTE